MNAMPTAQNSISPPELDVPDPVEEFGQDGGKFYRCYSTLADEIDEDMVESLKGQLEGMLIFAGLFAGVNTAFLALTLPLLSADPADDTNALLAQNNAILTQLVTGRNDSIPINSSLPSTEFSSTRDIFAINALFSLASYLQSYPHSWRSSLKRYLGAKRWKLELLLDDVLPSLLQAGLIIFCVSLILYLRRLSPAISIIVGIPLYGGLAFLVGSALCTAWD
ncbi:hypothetical protein M407DRAFT_21036 [Tulasnella calospora MUT 4182]|uniref:DUF6535 domain-containing protein n=1 Tax=Tulasnella calospora MUT 4182 TaxID=1051891 RepID=A0A0C3M7Y2_9AGAM|nr:hypothetical protein M407DRAFT_21036 [Tulasnella calospora MUT 4182]